MSIRPPGIKTSFDECDVWAKAQILAYTMIRDLEIHEEEVQKLKARGF